MDQLGVDLAIHLVGNETINCNIESKKQIQSIVVNWCTVAVVNVTYTINQYTYASIKSSRLSLPIYALNGISSVASSANA